MRVTAQTRSLTRQRILVAAQRLFAAQGFDEATTRDIARAAGIATGTLFNYFPTKEAVASALVAAAYESAAAKFEADRSRESSEPLSLEEELFAHVALALRKLKPYRKYVAAALDGQALSPDDGNGAPSVQATHLEVVGQIAARHGAAESLTGVALQLYWTLFLGVLAFWAKDTSPKQEDTLALLDQSLAMFCGWLQSRSPDPWSDAGAAAGLTSSEDAQANSLTENVKWTGDSPCPPWPS